MTGNPAYSKTKSLKTKQHFFTSDNAVEKILQLFNIRFRLSIS